MKLFDFAYCGSPVNYAHKLGCLSELATNENWGNKFHILKSYFDHTFRRLENESKIVYSEDNRNCAFNLGLLTKYDEEIFAVFESNKNQSTQDWYLKDFYSESNLLTVFSANRTPERADYFKEPSKLIYNPKRELLPNYEHIIEKNRERLPEKIQKESDEGIKGKLDTAINKITKRASVNYKLAVPQY